MSRESRGTCSRALPTISSPPSSDCAEPERARRPGQQRQRLAIGLSLAQARRRRCLEWPTFASRAAAAAAPSSWCHGLHPSWPCRRRGHSCVVRGEFEPGQDQTRAYGQHQLLPRRLNHAAWRPSRAKYVYLQSPLACICPPAYPFRACIAALSPAATSVSVLFPPCVSSFLPQRSAGTRPARSRIRGPGRGG